jgi:hypothetical protein
MTRLFQTLFLMLALTVIAEADGFDFVITRAEVLCDAARSPERLEIMINKSSNLDILIRCHGDAKCEERKARVVAWITATLRDPGNYHLMQIGTADRATVRKLLGSTLPTLELFNTLAFAIDNYDLTKQYALFAKDVSVKDDDDGSLTPFVIPVTVNSSCAELPQKLPDAEQVKPDESKTPMFSDYFAKPEIEASPKLKVDFGMQGTKKKKVISSFNVSFRPYTTRRVGFGGHYEITPFFVDTEYKANAEGSDKKNILTIGIFDTKLTKVFRDDGDESSNFFYRRVPAVVLSITPKLETEWAFKERNLVAAPRATLPINLYQSRRLKMRFDPFIGIEAGFTWASVISKPGKLLLRPLTGFGFTTGFLRKDEKPLGGVQIDYIRRFFLRPEYSFGPDATTGDLVRDRETKRPRDHVKARIFLNATELFAPFIEYEYGREPPKYNFINHSFKTGIAFNVDVVWKSFN